MCPLLDILDLEPSNLESVHRPLSPLPTLCPGTVSELQCCFVPCSASKRNTEIAAEAIPCCMVLPHEATSQCTCLGDPIAQSRKAAVECSLQGRSGMRREALDVATSLPSSALSSHTLLLACLVIPLSLLLCLLSGHSPREASFPHLLQSRFGRC